MTWTELGLEFADWGVCFDWWLRCPRGVPWPWGWRSRWRSRSCVGFGTEKLLTRCTLGFVT